MAALGEGAVFPRSTLRLAQVIDALRAAGVEYLVAPYEADAQVGTRCLELGVGGGAHGPCVQPCAELCLIYWAAALRRTPSVL